MQTASKDQKVCKFKIMRLLRGALCTSTSLTVAAIAHFSFEFARHARVVSGTNVPGEAGVAKRGRGLLVLVAGTLMLAALGAGAGAAPSVGGKIVFTSTRNNPLSWQIYTMNADGSHVTRLTNVFLDPSYVIRYPSCPPAFNGAADLSPDGRHIVFASESPVGYDQVDRAIYLMSVDGSHLRRLTHPPMAALSPSFSPDGRRIVFVASRHGPAHSYRLDQLLIYTMNVDGSNLFSTAQEGRTPSFSPDGHRIVYACYDGLVQQICAIDEDGSHLMRLTNSRYYYHSPRPKFSPDGRKIVLRSPARAPRGCGARST